MAVRFRQICRSRFRFFVIVDADIICAVPLYETYAHIFAVRKVETQLRRYAGNVGKTDRYLCREREVCRRYGRTVIRPYRRFELPAALLRALFGYIFNISVCDPVSRIQRQADIRRRGYFDGLECINISACRFHANRIIARRDLRGIFSAGKRHLICCPRRRKGGHFCNIVKPRCDIKRNAERNRFSYTDDERIRKADFEGICILRTAGCRFRSFRCKDRAIERYADCTVFRRDE